jgi:hypothetical protein|tara:strand:- start:4533 stop:5681 length:1149 start_codon:yes stop_codon:yes gene_type:complete
MNYKVMKRPMFKLGGKAASQGTGITSGLDEKVDTRLNLADSVDYSNMNLRELLDLQQANQAKQMSGLSDMRDIVKLNALSNLVGNVLPNIERGGFKGVTDFFRDPGTTQAALQGLTGLKKVDLQEKKLAGAGLDKYIAGRMGIETKELASKKFDFTKEQAILAGERADKKLEIAEKKSLVQTATAIKQKALNDSRALLEEYNNDINQMPESVKIEFYDLRSVGGDISPSKARQLAIVEINKDNRIRREMGEPELKGEKREAAIDLMTAEFLTALSGNAMGGTPNRVERQMGSPMMGEQPMTQAPQMMAPQQDVAMETQQDSGNKVYAMLRSRLPQEISDEVVQLISYNKEAFADFASIKNQEDVSSFNDKYGVQLVIDVATV